MTLPLSQHKEEFEPRSVLQHKVCMNKGDDMAEKQSLQKINCWEYMQCERHPGGNKVAELCLCPATVFTALPDGQYNAGKTLLAPGRYPL